MSLCDHAYFGRMSEIKGVRRYTPEESNIILVHAARGGRLSIVKYAIRIGAKDVNDALDRAAGDGHENIVNYLIRFCKPTEFNIPMCSAALTGYTKIVRRLLNCGATMYREAGMMAAYNGHLSVVEIMVFNDPSCVNDVALAGAEFGRINIVKFCLTNGATNKSEIKDMAVRRKHKYLLGVL